MPERSSSGGPFGAKSQQCQHLGKIHQPLRLAAFGRRQFALTALFVKQFLKAVVYTFREPKLLQVAAAIPGVLQKPGKTGVFAMHVRNRSQWTTLHYRPLCYRQLLGFTSVPSLPKTEIGLTTPGIAEVAGHLHLNQNRLRHVAHPVKFQYSNCRSAQPSSHDVISRMSSSTLTGLHEPAASA